MNRPEIPPTENTVHGIVVFDANVLGAMFGNETAVIASVLQTFMASTRTHLAELVQAIAAQDLETVGSLAHKVTGSSRLSGAMALGHATRGVEQAAELGDAAAVQRCLADVHAQWQQLETTMGTLPTPAP